MFMLAGVIFLVVIVLIVYLLAYFNFKKSRAGIALGVSAQIVFVTCCAFFAMGNSLWTVMLSDVPYLGSYVARQSWLDVLITVWLASFSIKLLYKIAISAMQNFTGPYCQSDDASNINLDNINGGDIISLLRVRLLFALEKKADSIIAHDGDDPYKVIPPRYEPVWKDLCVELLCSENDDLIDDTKQWSDTQKCWKIEKNDFLKDPVTVFILPVDIDSLQGLQESSVISRQLELISESCNAEDEFIIVSDPQVGAEFDNSISIFGVDNIRFVSKSAIVRNSLDMDKYCKALLKRYEKDGRVRIYDEQGGEGFLSLKDTYVMPRIFSGLAQEVTDDKQTVEFDHVLQSWLSSDGRDQLAILGEFGQGKSSAILKYAAEWAYRYLKGDISLGDTRVPLLIELRGRSPMHVQSPEDLLGQWGSRFGLSGAKLYNLIKSGKAVIIFEGFDEVKGVGQKLDRYESFNALWQFAFRHSKVIFTGRPNFFLGTEETKSIMRANCPIEGIDQPFTRIYSLDFLNFSEIEKVLRHVPADIRTGILSLVKEDEAFQSIAKRPSMLPVIASEWQSISTAMDGDEEVTSASIIKSYIESSFLRKESQPSEFDQYQSVSWELRYFLTQSIALFMLSCDGKNSITAGEIEVAIESIYSSLDEVCMGQDGSGRLASSWQNFKAFFDDNENAVRPKRDRIRALAHDVRANGVLGPDPAGGADSFYFPHKQFYEFLLAQSYYDFCISPQNSCVKALRSLCVIPSLSELMRCEPISLYHLSMLFKPDELKNNKVLRSKVGDSAFANIIRDFLAKVAISSFYVSSKNNVLLSFLLRKSATSEEKFQRRLDRLNRILNEVSLYSGDSPRRMGRQFRSIMVLLVPFLIMAPLAVSFGSMYILFLSVVLILTLYIQVVIHFDIMERYPLFLLYKHRMSNSDIQERFCHRWEYIMLSCSYGHNNSADVDFEKKHTS